MHGGEFLVARIPAGEGAARELRIAIHRLHPDLQFGTGAARGPAVLSQLAGKVLEDMGGERLNDATAGSRRVFVGSPGSDADRTITAFNLAWAIENTGLSVLLVEANFIQPRFRKLLGDLRFRFGVDSALRGTVVPAEGVFRLGEGRLYIAAVRNAVGAEPLGLLTERLEAYWEWAEHAFDVIVIDCPPVLSNDWNVWLSAKIGPTLLVVREEKTPQVDIKAAVERLGPHLMSVYLLKAATDDKALSRNK